MLGLRATRACSARPARSARPIALGAPRRSTLPGPLLAQAGGAEDVPPVTRLTPDDARRLLDVTPSATFEEVLQAKNRKLSAADGDMDKVVEIESAYDILFMTSMKKRITGELEVSTSVRYADVPSTPKRGAKQATKASVGGPGPLGGAKISTPKLPAGGMPVGIAMPANQQVALVQAGVFGVVALWALGQVLVESPDAQLADTAGLQIALALGYAVYSLREQKRMEWGKAVALVLGCLFAGSLIGTGIESWLRVDIVPIGNFGSPGVFVAEIVILLTALGTVFLV